MDEFEVNLDEKQLPKIRYFGVNLYGLLRAKYIYVDREKISFLIEESLPDCKLMMLSATVCKELYQKVYLNRVIDFHECPKAEYKGQIFSIPIPVTAGILFRMILTKYTYSRTCAKIL